MDLTSDIQKSKRSKNIQIKDSEVGCSFDFWAEVQLACFIEKL